MLHQLHISNFALIDETTISLNKGYTVITGETGSGKSILLNALNLILGERADFAVIGPKSNKAIVEAEFHDCSQFHSFFLENDLDFEDSILIRREISKDGKSRAFINDSPVSLTVLKALSIQLVQIHSQYNTLELKSKSYQLEVLDILAGLDKERTIFSQEFKKLQQKKRELHSKQEELNQALKSQDYNQFVLDELAQLQLLKTDYGKIENELLKLEQSEQLTSIFGELASLTDENNFYEKLLQTKNALEKVAHLDSEIKEIKERTASILLDLKELANDAVSYLESNSESSESKYELTEKVDAYNRILNKHRLTTQAQLLELEEEISKQTSSVDELQLLVNQLQDSIIKEEQELVKTATAMHKKRIAAVEPIIKALNLLLADLKLPHTKLEIVLTINDELSNFGNSQVSFLFSANLGVAPVPIEKAASGGELSRLMLALQQLISEKRALPTILFDEIDTGVSGDVAQKMGNLLKKMGERVQLIAISHLPQVAAKAAHHFVVSKELVAERMSTKVIQLNESERIKEVARLMSGEEITDAALKNAEFLMAQ
jgi:DNA repair protein RecN (Recombination protein N)